MHRETLIYRMNSELYKKKPLIFERPFKLPSPDSSGDPLINPEKSGLEPVEPSHHWYNDHNIYRMNFKLYKKSLSFLKGFLSSQAWTRTRDPLINRMKRLLPSELCCKENNQSKYACTNYVLSSNLVKNSMN